MIHTHICELRLRVRVAYLYNECQIFNLSILDWWTGYYHRKGGGDKFYIGNCGSMESHCLLMHSMLAT